MALTLPKLTLTRNQIVSIVGGVVVLCAAGWFGWQYFADAGPAPAAKPQPVAAAKQAAAAKDAAPAQKAAAVAPAADKPQADAQAAAAKPAAETVAVADAPNPADAQRDATPAQAKRRLPAANQDLRKCLDLESNAAIIKCAQP